MIEHTRVGVPPLWNFQEITVSMPDCGNQYYEVPHKVTSHFIGRHDILQKLEECCLPSGQEPPPKEPKRFVLHGPGGFGKTEICLKFAEDHRDKYACF